MDDWDERVDVVSRGVLGLTVACARCHDHKFDPISTRDYYSLASVFSSTVAVPRPVAAVDAEVEKRFMLTAQRLFYVSYVAKLLRSEPGSKPKESRQKVEQLVAELDKIEEEIAPLRQTHPDLYAYLVKLDRRPRPIPELAVATRPLRRSSPRFLRWPVDKRSVVVAAAPASLISTLSSKPACGSMAPTRT